MDAANRRSTTWAPNNTPPRSFNPDKAPKALWQMCVHRNAIELSVALILYDIESVVLILYDIESGLLILYDIESFS
ncbi:hypothetical protein N9K47_00225 [bacterium]|nr:hypothetical protein [bacterium]